MSKVRCSSCGAAFSSHKKNCPECGKERNKGGARLKPGAAGGNGRTVVIILLIIAIVACLAILAKLVFFSGDGEDISENTSTVTNEENSTDSNLDLPTIIDVDDINETADNGEDENTPEHTDLPDDTVTDPEDTTLPENTVTVTGIKLNTLYDSNNSRYDATLSKGETFQFKATTTPADQAVTWTMENPDVATVADTGSVTAVSSGSTKMTVTAGGYTVECIIRVN